MSVKYKKPYPIITYYNRGTSINPIWEAYLHLNSYENTWMAKAKTESQLLTLITFTKDYQDYAPIIIKGDIKRLNALSELEPAEPSELKSKIESQIQHLRNQKLCHTANLFVKIVSEFDRLTAENQRIQKASIKLGSWMSAALEDDKVCEEMKSDVREWFDSLGKE